MNAQHRTSQRLSTVALGALIACSPLWAQGQPRIYSSTETYGPYTLNSQELQQMPAGFVPIAFGEAVWVLGYSTLIVDSNGEEMSRDLQCHTVLVGEQDESWKGSSMSGAPFTGFFSDGYTPRLVLPEGTGVFFEEGSSLDLTPMFNNRGESAVEASMAVSIDFVRDADLTQPLKKLHSTVALLTDPFLYMVPPGGNVKEREYRFPYAGTIHAMGVHMHPYGRTFEIINLNRAETVWRAEGSVGEDDKLLEMPFFSSLEGYDFDSDDRFLLRATYANPTDVEQDAMAGLFIFFSTPDGEAPKKKTPL